MSASKKGSLMHRIAMGQHGCGTLFLLVLGIMIPVAIFSQNQFAIDIAAIMLFVLGLFITWTGLNQIREGKASVNWPQSAATLTRTGMKRAPGGKGVQFVLDIEYRYDAMGITRTGTRYRLDGGEHLTKDRMEKLIAEIEAEPLLLAWWDPDDPDCSTLNPGLHGNQFIRVVFGLVIIAAVIAWWMGAIELG